MKSIQTPNQKPKIRKITNDENTAISKEKIPLKNCENERNQILNDFSNRIDQIVEKTFQKKRNEKFGFHEYDSPRIPDVSPIGKDFNRELSKNQAVNVVGAKETKRKENGNKVVQNGKKPEDLQDKSFYNPTSNQNLDQIRCYIQNQNIIHQNPSPQYPFDEPPIINLSLNPVLAYPIMSPPQPNFSYNFNFQAPNPYPNQLPFANNPFLINNFPTNNGYYNFPMQMNNGPNYFSPNFPQMMYPQEPMNFSNDFQQINFNNGNGYNNNQIMNMKNYANINNMRMNNFQNNVTLENNFMEEQQNHNFFERKMQKQSENYQNKLENNGNNDKNQQNFKTNRILKDVFPKKTIENHEKSQNLSINDEFDENNNKKSHNIPLETKAKNQLQDIFAKRNSEANSLKNEEKSHRKKWGQEKEPTTPNQNQKNKDFPEKNGKNSEFSNKIPENNNKIPTKSINFEINFDENANVPLSEMFKNRKGKLMRKMEEQKQEKKEEKIEKPSNLRTKEEILKQRKEMMKKPEFLISKPIIEENNQILPSKKQFYVETVDLKNEKKGKEPPTHILERLAMGIKPKVTKKEMYSLTIKKYDELPEVKKKKEAEKKRNEIKERQEKVKTLEKKIRGKFSRNNSRQKNFEDK